MRQMPTPELTTTLSLGLNLLAAPRLLGLVGLDGPLGLADGGCAGDGVVAEVGAVVAASGGVDDTRVGPVGALVGLIGVWLLADCYRNQQDRY